jgi:predicted O-methyltransferase YrrM/D-alanine-D-alanine ligase-like ATP-grasp enzyme
MIRIGIITSDHREAGVIDCDRLSTQVSRLREVGVEAEIITDPSQWDLEKLVLTRSHGIFFPLTPYAFHCRDGTVVQRDYNIVAELERYDADFVGSKALTHQLVRDKIRVTRDAGIALPTFAISRYWTGTLFDLPSWIREAESLIAKPNDMTASIGIGRDAVGRPDQILERVQSIFSREHLCNHVLIQPYDVKCREFTVSILGDAKNQFASIIELKSSSGSHEVYSEDQKQRDAGHRLIHYEICDDPDIRDALSFHARRLFDWFNLRDYGRFDFILKDKPYLIDVNSMPVLGQSFGTELFARHGIEPDSLMAAVLVCASSRLAASGRPVSLPTGVAGLIPDTMLARFQQCLPASAVPESTIPTAFKPTTERYTMVDRVGAETEVLFFLKALVHLLKPDLVLETGTYRGATAGAIGTALAANGFGRLVTLERDAAFAAEARRRLCHLPVDVIVTSSLEYTPQRPIDLLFLDSHRPIRKLEFERFRSFLAPGALIVWHDSAPSHQAVHTAVAELSNSGVLDAIVLPTPRGIALSMLRKPPI